MTSALATLLLCEALFDHQAAAFLEQLGDDQYAVREAATSALVQMVQSEEGRRLLPRLRLTMTSPCPETARRAGDVVNAFHNLLPSETPVLPWIDMLPQTVQDRDNIIRSYRQKGHDAGCPCSALRWYDYRYATALYIEDLLQSGEPRSRVQALIDKMVTAEREYRTKKKLPDDY